MSAKVKPGDRFTDSKGHTVVIVDKHQKKQTFVWYLSKLDTAQSVVEHLQAYGVDGLIYPMTRGAVMPNGSYALCKLEEIDEESNEFGIVSP